MRVIRSRVTTVSRLIGRTAADANLRDVYKAAIVTVQRGGRNINSSLSTVIFREGDTLILQASDDSLLLQLKPPVQFYKELGSADRSVDIAAQAVRTFAIADKLAQSCFGNLITFVCELLM